MAVTGLVAVTGRTLGLSTCVVGLSSWACGVDLPAVSDVEQWTVSSAPVTKIGQLDGPDAAYSLEFVSDVRLLDDGNVAIADGRREVRIFTPTGRHV